MRIGTRETLCHVNTAMGTNVNSALGTNQLTLYKEFVDKIND